MGRWGWRAQEGGSRGAVNWGGVFGGEGVTPGFGSISEAMGSNRDQNRSLGVM